MYTQKQMQHKERRGEWEENLDCITLDLACRMGVAQHLLLDVRHVPPSKLLRVRCPSAESTNCELEDASEIQP